MYPMFTRACIGTVFILFLVISAIAQPKRIKEQAALDVEVAFEFEDSPRPQPPEVQAASQMSARELACEPLVIHAFIQAWKSTLNGTRNSGLGESGFAIDRYMTTLSVQGWREGTVNDLLIPADEDTIAVAHVHGRGADEHPARMDVQSRVPNFVISRDALYVTVPGSSGFVRVRGGVNERNGWNNACANPSLVAQR